MVPFCDVWGCQWRDFRSLSLWADVSIPSDHLAMISFPYLRWFKPFTVELYIGGRPPQQPKTKTDFFFPFLLSGPSFHVHYYNLDVGGSLFRMLFTIHQVNGLLLRGPWIVHVGRNSSVGSVVGSLSCLMQRRGFDPPLSFW